MLAMSEPHAVRETSEDTVNGSLTVSAFSSASASIDSATVAALPSRQVAAQRAGASLMNLERAKK